MTRPTVIRRADGHWKTLDWEALVIQHRYGQTTMLARETFPTPEEMQEALDRYLGLHPPFVAEEAADAS